MKTQDTQKNPYCPNCKRLVGVEDCSCISEIEKLRELCSEAGYALTELLDVLIRHDLIKPDGNYVALAKRLRIAGTDAATQQGCDDLPHP